MRVLSAVGSQVSIKESSRFRLAGVDLLRGVSVLAVVLHHIHLRFVLNGYPVNSVLPEPLNQVLFWSGYYAVITFFVVSGFLIAELTIRRWEALGNVHAGQFYWMRMARILPCLLLLLLTLSVLHLTDVAGFVVKPERASLGRALVAALTFHVNWLEGHRGYLPGGWDVLWSLSVEETFYLLFPLTCLAFGSEKRLIWPLLCLIILGPVTRILYADQDPWGSYAYLSCTDGIAFGCLAALASERLRLSVNVLRLSLMAGAAIALLVIIICSEDEHHKGLARYGLNVTVLEVAVALMLVPLGKGVGNRAMAAGTGWLRTVGRWSYEIYLFHMLVILGLMAWFKHSPRSGVTMVETYIAMLALSVALGALISRFYSERLNRLLRSVGQGRPSGNALTYHSGSP
jgi:peptidoglycan/LPS O-acetylase OafA/YrhL